MERTPEEFAWVISCDHCSGAGYPKLLRDDSFNLPQPGYIGSNYKNRRVLLVGQNPGVSPDRFSVQDTEFAEVQIALRNDASARSYENLKSINDRIMPAWPVVARQFPLGECGLRLNEIAYVNVVRCRTEENATPGKKITQACIDNHLVRWLDWLQPRVVVCIGKWAHDRIANLLEVRRIPHGFVNRRRSLSGAERQENRMQIMDLVRRVVAGKSQRAVLPEIEPPAQASSSRPPDANRASIESTTTGRSTLDAVGYIEVFAELGFEKKEKPNDSKPLRHERIRVPSLYFNRNKDRGIYYVGYKSDEQRYPARLWKRLSPQKDKDDKPNLITIVPMAGREREAFMELLKPTP